MGESWRDALSSLWHGLLYGGGSARFLRILLAVLLVASIGWSVYLYRQIITISRISPVEAPLPKPAAEQDQKYAELAKGFEEIAQVRTGNKEATYMASALGRYAFNEPPMPVVQEALAKVAAQKGKAPSMAIEQVYLPPYMEVRAIMILNKKPMALMNIEGEGDGVIVSPGYKFGGGRGRVVSITQTKVVVLWAGTSMELGLEAL